jgi:transposase-like protein
MIQPVLTATSGEALQGRRRYDPQFRQQALDYWRASGKTLAAAASDLGLKPWTLRDWKKRLAPAPPPGGGGGAAAPTIESLQAELQALRRQNVLLQQRCEILKKTLVIFSEPSPIVTPPSKP